MGKKGNLELGEKLTVFTETMRSVLLITLVFSFLRLVQSQGKEYIQLL